MCGRIGVIDQTKQQQTKQIRESIAYRGLDNEGSEIYESL